jgi:hypothetical protein
MMMMQVDGEPMLVNPCRIRLSLHNTVNMLTKRKAPCKIVLSLPVLNDLLVKMLHYTVNIIYGTFIDRKWLNTSSFAVACIIFKMQYIFRYTFLLVLFSA